MRTSLIDGFDAMASDLAARVGFAVVAPAPLVELRAYARERHWRNVRLVSTLVRRTRWTTAGSARPVS